MAEPETTESPRPMRQVRYIPSDHFVPILSQLGASLLISTYHAGKVVAIGTHEQKLELAVHNFELAMGMVLYPRQLAVGTRQEVWFLHSVPDVAPTLEPRGNMTPAC